MEARLATGTNDTLLKALDFDLEDVADYIIERQTATFQSQGNLVYSSQSGRLIRFVLSDNAMFLDPSSVRISYLLSNKSTNTGNGNDPACRTLNQLGPQSLFYRLRILMNSTLVEDITYYHRVTTMYDRLMPSTRRIEMTLENQWNASLPAEIDNAGTQRNQRKVVHGLAAGLFNSNERMIWLKVAPLQIELELVGSAGDAFATPTKPAAGGSVDTTIAWELSDVRLLADVVYCTSEFVDNFSRSLLKSIPLPIAITTYAVQKVGFVYQASSFTVNINRALTRLKSIWWTMQCADDSYPKSALDPANGASVRPFVLQSILGNPTAADNAGAARVLKEANLFYHPMKGSIDDNEHDTLEWRIQIGGRFFPTLPVKGIRESAWFLHKALGMSYRGSCDIPLKDYASISFVGAYSFEKAVNCAGEGASYSGESTIQGQQISLIVTNCPNPEDGLSKPNSATVILCHDEIINLRQEGCEVLV
jgi:hypothetical protein